MIPDYQSVMLPLLKYAGDKEEHRIRDAIEGLADEFKLTEEEKNCYQAVCKQFSLIELGGRTRI